MKPFFENAVLVTTVLSAGFWFASARSRLTDIGPGLEALDNLTIMSGDLQKISRWNAWAAGFMGVSAALPVLKKLIGLVQN